MTKPIHSNTIEKLINKARNQIKRTRFTGEVYKEYFENYEEQVKTITSKNKEETIITELKAKIREFEDNWIKKINADHTFNQLN